MGPYLSRSRNCRRHRYLTASKLADFFGALGEIALVARRLCIEGETLKYKCVHVFNVIVPEAEQY